MASATMATTMPLNSTTQSSFINPLPIISSKSVPFNTISSNSKRVITIQCSFKDKVLTGLTAASFTASMVIPEVAQAAGGDVTPSLKNFLLSIASGGVVLVAIIGAIAGVSNFDPVKRT
ncbi:hypothetical protein ACFE04_016947 [Oxalis oulophora]